MGNKRKLIWTATAVSTILLASLAPGRMGEGRGNLFRGPAPVFAEGASGKTHSESGDHDAHQDHEGPAEHDETRRQEDHPEHADESVVRLSEAERAEFGIELATAGPQKSRVDITLPGEVSVNADRLAHIVANVPGVAQEVRKHLGDQVRSGEVMAVIASRELADAKAQYLAATERVVLARARFTREKALWEKKISSDQEYLDAKQGLAEVRIEQRLAEQKLHALGFSEKYLRNLARLPDILLTRYEITAPIDGSVIQKHITLGEKLGSDTSVFTVADLAQVWVNLTVYQKDLAAVRVGQQVDVHAQHGNLEASGTIDYLSPMVDQATRTATARVVLDNAHGQWRPGTFVTGQIRVSGAEFAVGVSRAALQRIEGQTVVFVRTDEGFEARPVETGRSDGEHVEILSGLQAGQHYVKTNAFTLKAELGKGAFGDGHAH